MFIVSGLTIQNDGQIAISSSSPIIGDISPLVRKAENVLFGFNLRLKAVKRHL